MSLKKSVFQKNKYTVLKGVISKEIADFAFAYFLNKRKAARFLFDQKYISPFTTYWGVWNDEQVPNTYSHYADMVMETLLQKVKPGRMIFFPSYMPHMYIVDMGYEPFRFIHWNCQAIPKGVLNVQKG